MSSVAKAKKPMSAGRAKKVAKKFRPLCGLRRPFRFQ